MPCTDTSAGFRLKYRKARYYYGERSSEKRILSGIQPSGDLTLGSYLGAIRNWAALADEYDCYYMMADMHTITVRQVPAELRRHTLVQLAAYIASGLDPEKNVLFVQSHVPAHAQLGWVLDCYTMFGELSRMTQFKDKSAKNADNINAGLFTYPALMAADILLYQADLVPVGGDQKQHVEICRDIATRFNGLYGDTFKLPDPYIPKVGARIMSLTTPTSKMSKSDKDQNGCVYMLEKPEDILRKFKKAMTDSDACVHFDPENKPGVSNLMQIYSVATGRDYAAIEAEFAGQGYGSFKTAVGESVVELLRPIREETERLLADKAYLESVYRAGAEKAAYVANRTLSKVYKKWASWPGNGGGNMRFDNQLMAPVALALLTALVVSFPDDTGGQELCVQGGRDRRAQGRAADAPQAHPPAGRSGDLRRLYGQHPAVRGYPTESPDAEHPTGRGHHRGAGRGG